MNFKEWLLTGLLIVLSTVVIINDYKLEQEAKLINAIEIPTEDYLVPGTKSAVTTVISEYYEEHPIVIQEVEKEKPAAKKPVKKQPKKTTSQKKKVVKKQTVIDIHQMEVIDHIAIYIKKKEGFRSKAYYDNTQYSNGYGTKAKSKTECITQKEANIRLYKHIRKVIIPALDGVKFKSIEQVYSAIDFSYNLGHNRFKRDIVNPDGTIACHKMMSYNKMRDKSGKLIYNEGLAQRRFENFLECSAYDIVE